MVFLKLTVWAIWTHFGCIFIRNRNNNRTQPYWGFQGLRLAHMNCHWKRFSGPAACTAIVQTNFWSWNPSLCPKRSMLVWIRMAFRSSCIRLDQSIGRELVTVCFSSGGLIKNHPWFNSWNKCAVGKKHTKYMVYGHLSDIGNPYICVLLYNA